MKRIPEYLLFLYALTGTLSIALSQVVMGAGALVGLIDRGQREIPIQADIVGATMELDSSSHIKLEGPEPLQLVIKTLERNAD